MKETSDAMSEDVFGTVFFDFGREVAVECSKFARITLVQGRKDHDACCVGEITGHKLQCHGEVRFLFA